MSLVLKLVKKLGAAAVKWAKANKAKILKWLSQGYTAYEILDFIKDILGL